MNALDYEIETYPTHTVGSGIGTCPKSTSITRSKQRELLISVRVMDVLTSKAPR